MNIGDMVRDSSYGMIGIIIANKWHGIDNSIAGYDQIYDFGVLYEDGHIFGADEREIEAINESR